MLAPGTGLASAVTIVPESFAAGRRCPGADGVTFAEIEVQGVEAWLASLQEEQRHKTYCVRLLMRRSWRTRNSSSLPARSALRCWNWRRG
jgi:hypothetical protein